MQKLLTYIGAVFILLEISCKKDIQPLLPGGMQDVSVNFFNASDILGSLPFYQTFNNPKYIFIDTLPKNVVLNSGAYPSFAGQGYPDNIGGSDVYNGVQFMRLMTGIHRIWFSDTARAIHVIADTTINLAALSLTAFYLADAGNSSNNDIAAYRVIAIPEERKGTQGRVRVRLINLSPDIGSVSCYLQRADGSTLFSPLPQQLSFGKASPYIELDTAGASLGSLTLQIIADKDPFNNLLTTRLSASPGHSYVVVVQGFSQTVTRQVPIGKNLDESLKYAPVTIPANIRAIIRESY